MSSSSGGIRVVSAHVNTVQGNGSYSEKNTVTKAKEENEAAEHNDKQDVRGHIVRIFKRILSAGSIFIIAVMFIYFISLVLEPFVLNVGLVKKNFEMLFFKIIELLPWVLLFIFGDKAKIFNFLKLANSSEEDKKD